jgi:hypothetical protein
MAYLSARFDGAGNALQPHSGGIGPWQRESRRAAERHVVGPKARRHQASRRVLTRAEHVVTDLVRQRAAHHARNEVLGNRRRPLGDRPAAQRGVDDEMARACHRQDDVAAGGAGVERDAADDGLARGFADRRCRQIVGNQHQHTGFDALATAGPHGPAERHAVRCPDTLDFPGEQMPLERSPLQVRLHLHLHGHRARHSGRPWRVGRWQPRQNGKQR